MAIWVAAILLVAAVALFIAAPLSDDAFGSSSAAGDVELAPRAHQHVLAVQALRELEFDHAMGKLDAADYRVLRENLEIRALAVIGELKKMSRQSPLEQPAATVVGRPQSIVAVHPVSVNFCPQCGSKSDAHYFCDCGAALAAPAGTGIK